MIGEESSDDISCDPDILLMGPVMIFLVKNPVMIYLVKNLQ